MALQMQPQPQPLNDPYHDLPSIDIDVLSLKEQYIDVMGFVHETIKRIADEDYKGVPITPKKISYMRINLIFPGKTSIPLIIDASSGYLCGFRTGDGRWLCFKDTILPNVDATIIPKLTSNYTMILPIQCYDLLVGKPYLENAFHELSSFKETLPPNHPKMVAQKKALARLIVMFCEASRFHPVFRFVKTATESDESLKVPPHLWTMIKNFSTISRFALHCKEKDEVNQPYDQKEIDMVAEHSLTTGEGARELLRVIKGPKPNNSGAGISKSGTSRKI